MSNSNKLAFPGGRGIDFIPGMTLREWLAGMAMQGELANNACLGSGVSNDEDRARFAEWCFKMADAMIAESDKQG